MLRGGAGGKGDVRRREIKKKKSESRGRVSRGKVREVTLGRRLGCLQLLESYPVKGNRCDALMRVSKYP